jgi:hypothetical protein
LMLAATVISVLALTYQFLASAFFLKTHQIGSLGELLYLFHNFNAMAPAIAAELDWRIGCVCLVMFGSALLLGFGWRTVKSPGKKSRAERLRAVGLLTVAGVLLLAANVHPQSVTRRIRMTSSRRSSGRCWTRAFAIPGSRLPTA